MQIPSNVSGYPVSNRAVHLLPFGFHGDWTKDAAYWTNLLRSMHMSWAIIINTGDSVRQTYTGDKRPLELLLDAGIIPIIRDSPSIPHPWTNKETMRWTVELYGRYGLKPFWIIGNEPFDEREIDKDWVRKKNPTKEQIWEAFMSNWASAAHIITDSGGYVGFPDGPAYDFNPFESIENYRCGWIFREGLGFYAGHFYGKNRPVNYPYDDVPKNGTELT